VAIITDKSFSIDLDIKSLCLLEAQPISQMRLGARVDIQLSSTSNLTFGSIDVDISIRSLSINLKSSTVPLLIQVQLALKSLRLISHSS
jgi:hypothetical protein